MAFNVGHTISFFSIRLVESPLVRVVVHGTRSVLTQNQNTNTVDTNSKCFNITNQAFFMSKPFNSKRTLDLSSFHQAQY